jgi:uncharacterized protein YndB with AHSA1/START domain
MSAPVHGYLLIADITGYTRFLKNSELEHARGILEALFAALLQRLRSPFLLSNLQGDAILAHAPNARVSDGQHVLDVVDSLYFAFAETLERMIRNTTCTCAACSNIRNLDLKLVVHHGAYVEQNIGGRKELGGPDVILVHRLMKNGIVPSTGIRAYAAFTNAAVAAISLSEFFADATRHVEHTDEFGDVALRVLNLQPGWEKHRSQRQVAVKAGDPQLFEEVSADLRMTPDRCWYYMTTPELRGKFVPNVVKFTRYGADRGRPGLGMVDHCAHGDGSVLVFNIVEWRPHEQISYRVGMPMGGAVPLTITVSPIATGCHVVVRTGLPIAPNPFVRALLRVLCRMQAAKIRAGWVESLEKLAKLADSDVAEGHAPEFISAHTPAAVQQAVAARL